MIFPMLTACLLCFGQAKASNVLTVSDVEIPIGGQATIEIGCDFDTEFTAFELQLALSEGLTLVTDEEGNPIVERGFEGSHEVLGNLLPSNGNYKFVCYSMDKESLPLNGTLIRVTIKADDGLQPGTTLSAGIVSCEFVRTFDSKGEYLADKDMPVPVRDIKAGQKDDAAIYDIHGRRVEKMRKGIYIIGGKKELRSK